MKDWVFWAHLERMVPEREQQGATNDGGQGGKVAEESKWGGGVRRKSSGSYSRICKKNVSSLTKRKAKGEKTYKKA